VLSSGELSGGGQVEDLMDAERVAAALMST
jgi:hypothetical protein